MERHWERRQVNKTQVNSQDTVGWNTLSWGFRILSFKLNKKLVDAFCPRLSTCLCLNSLFASAFFFLSWCLTLCQCLTDTSSHPPNLSVSFRYFFVYIYDTFCCHGWCYMYRPTSSFAAVDNLPWMLQNYCCTVKVKDYTMLITGLLFRSYWTSF